MQQLDTSSKEIAITAVDQDTAQPIATRRNSNDLQTETSRETEKCLETSDNAQIQMIETVNEIVNVTVKEIVTETAQGAETISL